MLSRAAPRSLRYVCRSLRTPGASVAPQTRAGTITLAKSFTSSAAFSKGLQPSSSNPQPPTLQSAPVAGAASHVTEPSPLTPEEYHDYSEHYFNVLLGHLEKAQEEGSDVEAEYSVSLAVAVISVSPVCLSDFRFKVD